MFQRVLIATDGSENAAQAAEAAARLGLIGRAAATIVGVLDLDGITMHGLSALNEEERMKLHDSYQKSRLAPLANALTSLGVQIRGIEVLEGSPAEAIITAAERDHSDLLVIGRRGLGRLGRFFLGSVSMKVLGLTQIPVLIVPAAARSTAGPRPIIYAPTDFSTFAGRGLATAHVIARALSGRLIISHALHNPDFRAQAEAKLAELAAPIKAAGQDVETEVVESDGGKALVAAAERRNASLIALTSHGRTGIRRLLLGGFAASIIEHASVPVLVSPAC